MDSNTYHIISSGDMNQLKHISRKNLSFLSTQHQKNSSLHIAVLFRKMQCVEEICNRCPLLLTIQNLKGDTPLHIASRLGSSSIVGILIHHAKNYNGGGGGVETVSTSPLSLQHMVRMENNNKDIALHEAVRYHRFEVVKKLTEADPDHQHSVNNDGETPLYLAAEKGLYDCVYQILDACPGSAHTGPCGRTAMHAAIMRRNSDIATLLLEKRKTSIIREVDEKGCGLLHYAAYYGEIEMVAKLLDSDPSLATTTDRDGKTALHIAASSRWSSRIAYGYETHKGTLIKTFVSRIHRRSNVSFKFREYCTIDSLVYRYLYKVRWYLSILRKWDPVPSVGIIKEVTDRCPECWEVLDNNGQNVLHVAAENGQLDVMKYIVMKSKMASNLINEKDSNGNTPLHLVLKSRSMQCFKVLCKYRGVNTKAINNAGLKALDIVLNSLADAEGSYKVFLLKAYGILCEGFMWINGGRLIREEERQKTITGLPHLRTSKDVADYDIEEKDKKEKLTEAQLVVAALIGTVSFAAGLTPPGGYHNDGPYEGRAALTNLTTFKIFVVFNSIAMVLSASAIFINFNPKTQVRKNRGIWFNSLLNAQLFISCAIVAMVVAFLTGVFAVLSLSPFFALIISLSSACLFIPPFTSHLRYCLDVQSIGEFA